MNSKKYTVTNYQLQAWSKYIPWATHHPNISDTTVFDSFRAKLIDKESFHVARYNDGEWIFMLEVEPHFEHFLRVNGHDRDQVREISGRLNTIFDSQPDYYIGIDSTTRAYKGLVAKVTSTLEKKIATIKNLIYGDVFNAATVKYGAKYLTDALKERIVITVGPQHLTQLGISDTHISVPERNCWVQSHAIEHQVREAIESYSDQHPVVLYSCSLLAKLLVDIFYNEYGDKITQMDVGSCLDPWCGVYSRPWHIDIVTYYNRYIREKLKQNTHASYATEAEQAIEGNTSYTGD